MSTQRVRLGAIGYGARGNLLSEAAGSGEAQIVALADPSAPAREKFTARFPEAATCDDYRALLDRNDLDAVIVLSPDFLHEEHALAILNSGRYVYLEKPMTITAQGCDRVLAADLRAGGRVFVGHNLRHHNVFLKMKQLIDDGAIGQVKAGWCRHFVAYGGDFYFKDWHAERQRVNSLLLQKGAHDIDVLHWLCGGHSVRVSAMGELGVYDKAAKRREDEKPAPVASLDHWPPLAQTGFNPRMDVEDLSMMLMTLNNGVLCSYQQCHYAPDCWRNYTIIGTSGRLENINDRPGEAVVRVWNRRTMFNPYGDEQHFIPRVEGGHGGADGAIIRSFFRFVRGEDRQPSVPVVMARHAVAAGDYATRSLRQGSAPLDIPAAPSA
jgi:predicted dehydrogenase